MALSDAQKASIRRYLGYPDVNRRNYHNLEGALDELSTEGETIVTGILTLLDSLDTKLQSSWDRQKVIRAEDVVLTGAEEIRALRAEGQRLANSLAQTLNVRPLGGYFMQSGGGLNIAYRG